MERKPVHDENCLGIKLHLRTHKIKMVIRKHPTAGCGPCGRPQRDTRTTSNPKTHPQPLLSKGRPPQSPFLGTVCIQLYVPIMCIRLQGPCLVPVLEQCSTAYSTIHNLVLGKFNIEVQSVDRYNLNNLYLKTPRGQGGEKPPILNGRRD